MREKRPLSPIHSFRLEYNALVKKLHKLNEGDNSSGKQWQIDDMIKKNTLLFQQKWEKFAKYVE